MGLIEYKLALLLIEIIEEYHFLISLADVRSAIFAHKWKNELQLEMQLGAEGFSRIRR